MVSPPMHDQATMKIQLRLSASSLLHLSTPEESVMDPVGGVASLLTLVATAISITKTTIKLIHDIQDAPRELQEIVIKISIVRNQLEQLSGIGRSLGEDDDRISSTEFRSTVTYALDVTRDANLNIIEAIRPLMSKHGFTSRLQWALLERNRIEKLLEKLNAAQSSLCLALQILEIETSLLVRRSVLDIQTNMNQLIGQVDCMRNSIKTLQLAPTSRPINPFHWQQPPKSAMYDSQMLISRYHYTGSHGGFGTIAYNSNPSRTTYALSLGYGLSLWGSRTMFLDVRIRYFAASYWKVQVERCILAVKKVVPDDSVLMKACENGDLFTVRKAFQDRTASPSDVTSAGRTPLMLAIKGGNLKIVQLLLDSGADVNASFSDLQISPLQLAAKLGRSDICRVLLQFQASSDHTDARGWTIAFYLWPEFKIQSTSRTECLSLMQADGGCDVSSVAEHGWTALHRAAAAGTAEDVSTLISCGANLKICTTGLDWTPLHYATLACNDPVLHELAKPQYQIDFSLPDARGWSPLHIAAWCGDKSTVSTLLRLGADPHRLSIPTASQVPSNLRNQSFTAGEAARKRGPDIYESYLDAVRQSGLSYAIDEAGDLFWDATQDSEGNLSVEQ